MDRIDLNAVHHAGRLRRWGQETWRLLVTVYNELWRTRAFTIAAALAFYFMFSLVPILVIFSSLLQFLPVPDVFQQILDLMARLVPPDSMTFVERILADILTPNRGKLLSFGILGYLWTASGGFSSLIESLDIAYDVKVSRPWWRDRIRALVLAFSSGGLVALSVLMVILGPHFGHFLTEVFPVPRIVEHLWPVIRPVFIFVTFVTGLEVIYYLGPNARHSFFSTLPGAALAISVWLLGSWGLNYYLSHISNYNATYGSMGAIIGLMLWFYMTALAILIGAELNAELAKQRAALRAVREMPPEPEKLLPGPLAVRAEPVKPGA
ncbi:MAG: YihY/virulence factor BrkB family protein [Acidobacteriaceae bacterium]|nr:YihY/virulence factor BrkB family protein [Acidobacteriaceae bacterium]